jgi:hypothetical protein
MPFDKAEVLLRVSNALLAQWLRKQGVTLEEQIAGLKSKQTA